MRKALLIILLLFLVFLGFGCGNNEEKPNPSNPNQEETNEPATDDPVVDPIEDEPATEDPKEDDPKVEDPSTDNPTTDDPVEDPIEDDPPTEDPVIDEPVGFDGKLTEEEMRKAIYDITRGENGSLHIEVLISGKDNGLNVKNIETVIIKRDGILFSIYEMLWVEYNVNKSQFLLENPNASAGDFNELVNQLTLMVDNYEGETKIDGEDYSFGFYGMGVGLVYEDFSPIEGLEGVYTMYSEENGKYHKEDWFVYRSYLVRMSELYLIDYDNFNYNMVKYNEENKNYDVNLNSINVFCPNALEEILSVGTIEEVRKASLEFNSDKEFGSLLFEFVCKSRGEDINYKLSLVASDIGTTEVKLPEVEEVNCNHEHIINDYNNYYCFSYCDDCHKKLETHPHTFDPITGICTCEKHNCRAINIEERVLLTTNVLGNDVATFTMEFNKATNKPNGNCSFITNNNIIVEFDYIRYQYENVYYKNDYFHTVYELVNPGCVYVDIYRYGQDTLYFFISSYEIKMEEVDGGMYRVLVVKDTFYK